MGNFRGMSRVQEHLSVDLDSTLCDTRHRQGIVEQYRSQGLPVDWDVYALACAEDAPTAFVSLLRAIQQFQPWHVLSGRSEGAREATENWLHAQGLFPLTINLEDGDTESHTNLGHAEWKARRVLWLAERFPISMHVDDYSEVSERVEEMSEGRIKGLTVTPPGMRAVFPENRGDAVAVPVL